MEVRAIYRRIVFLAVYKRELTLMFAEFCEELKSFSIILMNDISSICK